MIFQVDSCIGWWNLGVGSRVENYQLLNPIKPPPQYLGGSANLFGGKPAS